MSLGEPWGLWEQRWQVSGCSSQGPPRRCLHFPALSVWLAGPSSAGPKGGLCSNFHKVEGNDPSLGPGGPPIH